MAAISLPCCSSPGQVQHQKIRSTELNKSDQSTNQIQSPEINQQIRSKKSEGYTAPGRGRLRGRRSATASTTESASVQLLVGAHPGGREPRRAAGGTLQATPQAAGKRSGESAP
jgi:hypothetical protein